MKDYISSEEAIAMMAKGVWLLVVCFLIVAAVAFLLNKDEDEPIEMVISGLEGLESENSNGTWTETYSGFETVDTSEYAHLTFTPIQFDFSALSNVDLEENLAKVGWYSHMEKHPRQVFTNFRGGIVFCVLCNRFWIPYDRGGGIEEWVPVSIEELRQ